MMLKVLDLFSGIGGFSLGLERTGGFETAAFCEIEEYPRKVLAKHWPDVPIYEDVCRTPIIECDVVTGGFPCQPFSTAAHGMNNARDFWPEMLQAIKANGPRFVIAENVSKKAIRKAERDLQDEGYRTTSIRISASDCGADHQRNRWWLCAYPDTHSELHGCINAKASKLQELCEGLWGAENLASALRVSDGVPNRLDRVRCLGNAVVPQIPEMIGYAILEANND